MGRSRQVGKHKKILQAAVKIFAEKGFYKAKISEIAREAGVADGTIYLYFKNKDDILIQLFEEEMDRMINSMREELLAFKDPLQKLSAFVHRHLQVVEENPRLAEVIQVELRQSNKFVKNYTNRKFQEYLNILEDIIREGQTEGLIRLDIDPGVAKRVIFGALDEMSTFWVLSKKKSGRAQEVARQVTELVIKGVVYPGHKEQNARVSLKL
ncbi:MAG: TetR/AcrR family transcriptional regulator [Candidatus Bathyarchaeia archaeon]